MISFALQEAQAAVRLSKGKVVGREATVGKPDKKWLFIDRMMVG